MNTIIAPSRGICTVDSVTRQLLEMHVDVHHVTYGPGHRFDPCAWCGEWGTEASNTVYSVDDGSHDVCLHCTVKAAQDAVEGSNGRPDLVTVELGTVAPPSPSVVLVPTQRQHDLAALLPVACETCAPIRGSVATWQIEIERVSKGEVEPIRWLVCDRCQPSMVRAAHAQHQGFAPPLMSELPVTERIGAAA